MSVQALPIPTIDGHVHLTHHDGIEDLMGLSRAAGIGRTCIVCVPGTPERSLNCNACALLAKGRHPRECYVFGGLVYNIDGPATAGDLRRQAVLLQEAGCDGIKMLEGKPTSRKRIGLRLDDPVYDAFYDFLQESGMPIISHVADPATFWDAAHVPPSARASGWDYSDGTFPAPGQLYAEMDHVLKRFPRLRVVLAHFYFLSRDMARAERILDEHPGVSFDITPGSEMYRNFSDDPPGWHGFFTRYQDRLIFGTDNHAPRAPWAELCAAMLDKVRMMRQFLETTGRFEGFGTATRKHVMGIGLGRGTLEKIYAGNFERLAGAAPRPLNPSAVRTHTARVLAFARRTPGQQELREELEAIMENF
jgi:predicted TIM-barrel fold metal-dependent hydrolase